MNLLFSLWVTLLASTSTPPDTAHINWLYPPKIDFGTVPVWASAHPVRWSDLGRDTTSSVYIGPASGDAMVILVRRCRYRIIWPLYTAILNGDTLTYRLLGSDHERVMEAMGYSDNTPYKLRVTTVTIDVTSEGEAIGHPRYREMSKRQFDRRYGAFHQVQFVLLFGLPLPPPQ